MPNCADASRWFVSSNKDIKEASGITLTAVQSSIEPRGDGVGRHGINFPASSSGMKDMFGRVSRGKENMQPRENLTRAGPKV